MALAGAWCVLVVFVLLIIVFQHRRRSHRTNKPLPSAQEIVDQLAEDLRHSIEDFLRTKCGVTELSEGDIPVIAILSKFSSEHWDMATEYIRTGLDFGQAASYVGMMGRCIGFDELLEAFSWAERRYADHGFIPIAIDLFEGWAGWGNSRQAIAAMGAVNKQKMPVALYAAVYRKAFLPESYPKNNLVGEAWETGEAQVGNYLQPAPEKALKNMSAKEKAEVMYSPSFRN